MTHGKISIMRIDRRIIEHIIDERNKFGDIKINSSEVSETLKLTEALVESRFEYLIKNGYVEGTLAHKILFSPFEDSPKIYLNATSVITNVTSKGENFMRPVIRRKSFWTGAGIFLTIISAIVGIVQAVAFFINTP